MVTPIRWEMADALRDLEELADYLRRPEFGELREQFHALLDRGAVGLEIDRIITEVTGDRVAIYKINDLLAVLLTAARARDVHVGKMVGGTPLHSSTPVD
jgi:hypothetical protein